MNTTLESNGKGGVLVGIGPRAFHKYLPLATAYWDKIKLVVDPLLPTDGSGPVAELISAGVLKAFHPPLPDGPANPETMAEVFKMSLLAPFQVFEESNQREPGAWSFLPLSDVFRVPRSKAIASRAIEMCLYSKLAMPAPATPIEKVLNFKAKHEGELHAFRDSMDTLYHTIINSADSSAALNSATEKLDRAISDVFKSMNERFETKLLSRLTVSAPLGAVLGALAGHAVAGLPGAVAGAALSGSIGLQVKPADVPRGSSPGAPFAYVAGMIEDVL